MLSMAPTVNPESATDRLQRELAAGGAVALVTPEALAIATTLLRVALDPVAARAAVESLAAEAAKVIEARTAFDAAKREHADRAAQLDARADELAKTETAIAEAQARLAAEREALDAKAADVEAKIERIDRVRAEFKVAAGL